LIYYSSEGFPSEKELQINTTIIKKECSRKYNLMNKNISIAVLLHYTERRNNQIHPIELSVG